MLYKLEDDMTKAAARKLQKGVELFNTETGEVASFTSAIFVLGDTLYIEGTDRNGKFHLWPHSNTERV